MLALLFIIAGASAAVFEVKDGVIINEIIMRDGREFSSGLPTLFDDEGKLKPYCTPGSALDQDDRPMMVESDCSFEYIQVSSTTSSRATTTRSRTTTSTSRPTTSSATSSATSMNPRETTSEAAGMATQASTTTVSSSKPLEAIEDESKKTATEESSAKAISALSLFSSVIFMLGAF